MAINIGKKILTMILISIVLTALTMFGSFYFYNQSISDNIKIIKNANSSLVIFKDIELKLQLYKTRKDIKLINASKINIDKFIEDLSNRSDKIQQSRNPELMTNIEEVILRSKEIQMNIDTLQKGVNELSLTKSLSVLESIEPKLHSLIFFEEKKFDKEIVIIRIFILGATILIALIILTFSLRISQSVVTPIHKLISVAISSSKGDLTQSIKVGSKDEMGALANAFNTLVENLTKILTQLKNTSELISKYSGEFAALSENLNSSATNITNSVSGIARGAYIQTKQIEKTSQVIEQMLTSVDRVATRTQIQDEKTNLAASISKKGSDLIRETINKMNQINISVNNSANIARKLKERSTHVGQIVEVITKIAEQTNLLAINTAIEAARAGEGAQEFRVIADEVRKLAEATGKATEQIIKLLKEIQNETNEAISATEGGLKEVQAGVVYINKTGSALEELSSAVLDISNLSSEISKNTKEQSSSCELVRKAISAIAKISEENAKSTDDVLNLAQSQADLTKKIFGSSTELKKLSVELVDIAKKFKVAKQENK
ncbi:MAG: methyl-accepting chemotaxis protein [Candidatus Firestonebacteria bacterium]